PRAADPLPRRAGWRGRRPGEERRRAPGSINVAHGGSPSAVEYQGREDGQIRRHGQPPAQRGSGPRIHLRCACGCPPPRHGLALTMTHPTHDGVGDQAGARDEPFRLEEATIEELHAAIQTGRTTCVAVVQHYIERVRAYNGVASLLVTEDGAPVPEATGAVRATVPLRFPTETVKCSDVLPDLDKYKGPALEYGRMEATASDPGVPQQFGMIAGTPDAGQVNAL